MVKTSNLNEKEQWVIKRLIYFYSDVYNIDSFLNIINNKKNKKVSLRLIDWFVTNYSKKNNTTYPIVRPNGAIEYFSPYQRYRDQLTSYPKKLFDPFCRGTIFKFQLNNETVIDTTVCQLNFFKWAIENLLLDYIEQHVDEIYTDMQANITRHNKNNTIKATKQQLSESIYQKIVCLKGNALQSSQQ